MLASIHLYIALASVPICHHLDGGFPSQVRSTVIHTRVLEISVHLAFTQRWRTWQPAVASNHMVFVLVGIDVSPF